MRTFFSLVVVQSKQVGEPMAFAKFFLAYLVSLVMLTSGFVGNVYLGTDIGAGEKSEAHWRACWLHPYPDSLLLWASGLLCPP